MVREDFVKQVGQMASILCVGRREEGRFLGAHLFRDALERLVSRLGGPGCVAQGPVEAPAVGLDQGGPVGPFRCVDVSSNSGGGTSHSHAVRTLHQQSS